jgi:hypothetical protein
MSLTLDELIRRLQQADRDSHAMEGAKAGRVQFRFAVNWADYDTSTVSDLDPFGPIIGVTTTLDGMTIVDVLAELRST